MTGAGGDSALQSPHPDAAAVDLLHELVATPSVSGDERRAAERLVERMKHMGYRASIDEAGNAVGIRGDDPLAPGVKTIVLLGHIDTVPGDIPVRIEGDVLHGRGAVDAKGPLACFAAAGARARLTPGIAIVVIGATEEELPSSRGARHAAVSFAPAACIIGEPSSAAGITLGYKGRLIVRARFEVDNAHSAGPGMSAPDAAFAWWGQVVERCNAWELAREPQPSAGAPRGPFWRLQSRIISCSSADDGMRDTAEWRCGFRLPPGIESAEVESWCREYAAEIAARAERPPADADAAPVGEPMLRAAIHAEGREHAVVADRTNSVARALASAIREHAQRPVYKLKTGTSDMNVVGPVWGCPIAAYGPGDSALDHTPREHISISEYLSAIAILTRGLEHLAAELAPGQAANHS